MRNATILVFRLKGVATETIKNIVLAGIGKLIVVDHEDVAEEDLGANFFFREDDVGKKVGHTYHFVFSFISCCFLLHTLFPVLSTFSPAYTADPDYIRESLGEHQLLMLSRRVACLLNAFHLGFCWSSACLDCEFWEIAVRLHHLRSKLASRSFFPASPF